MSKTPIYTMLTNLPLRRYSTGIASDTSSSMILDHIDTLSQILRSEYKDIQGQTFTINGRITEIHFRQSWHYTGCPTCHKSTRYRALFQPTMKASRLFCLTEQQTNSSKHHDDAQFTITIQKDKKDNICCTVNKACFLQLEIEQGSSATPQPATPAPKSHTATSAKRSLMQTPAQEPATKKDKHHK
ncbi:hypothetical protein M8C21_018909 [Ambrosia artemisiifolia]|uniref:Uncharacterized protein n=1 Tax=Ambrosia artemisiifolia TaxID=4212 RepID=A0AAD5D5T7_AMBAR|nr:hypothetical protein M8C21_018909 [Ambrosia artemisiifolia]